ncbi:MAG: DUF4982 domain-containing protein [Salinivirgaceae bacterium]|jgi:beta-galactosidase|nr:DUF4982 domain-containing protein [Salinivirgaceae bacterium]
MKSYRVTNILWLVAMAILFVSCNKKAITPRENLSFNENWKFILHDSSAYNLTNFNDEQWRNLNLPHDWSIEGKFSEHAPAGTGGGALPGGVGWYRKQFTLPISDTAKKIYITFDGVYQNSEVYINGQLLGKRPNGYISFQYDLTPYLSYGNKENTIAVRVDNSDQPNSRWYSGSGIYRNVWLLKTNPIHVNLWGTHITTPTVNNERAEVNISIEIKNTSAKTESLKVITKIIDNNGNEVTKVISNIDINENTLGSVKQKLSIKNPILWSTDNPYLYKAVNYIKLNNKTIDVYETTFGIRYFEFNSEKGFLLNGMQVKIKGVCNHHDLGALGSAISMRGKERQIEILKKMGCNGIRTSHNPPSPELLNLCDRMGFIVQNETFDVWAMKKVENDYAKYWDEWHVKDLTDHLLRDRNHASVFSWSIGNEILEQWDTSGVAIAKELASIVKQYAPNMPVTSGCNDPEPHNNIIKSGALDLIGFNYHHETFELFQEKFPGQVFIGTETGSSLNSRGVYNMPSDSINIWPVRWDIPFNDGNPDNTCSSYDNCRAPWGSTHSDTWKLIKKHDYLSGMYIWTGFDYLGEPTPYQWPSRSSYFGIIDLAGFPKDAYYMYQSEWTDEPVLHIFPHWNWEEGQNIDIWAYTNFDEVELFINDKSQGIKSKKGDDLRIQWNVNFEAGTLKAVGKKANGDTKEVVINTAGKAAKILLEADRSAIKADNADLSFVTVTILDKDGNMVPNADNLVTFEVSELARIAGVDNGLQTSMESFKANYRKAYNGKCLVILQAGKKSGTALLKAKAEGLIETSIEINLQ